MNLPRPNPIWALGLLGATQAALAGSILFRSPALWGLCAAGYALWLACVAIHFEGRTMRIALAGYALPVALFAGLYARAALGGRPETARAIALLRTAPPPDAATKSDVPSPKLAPAGGTSGLTRGLWVLTTTFLYLAACAVVGLFGGTPLLVYAAAFVVGLLSLGRGREPP